MKALAALITLLCASTTMGEVDTFHSKLVTFDEAAIVKFCKQAIAKSAPKVDRTDLELYSIEHVRNFKGAYEPFPIELRVTFLLSSSREIYGASAGSKEKGARVSYSAIFVSIDPNGDLEKSVVTESGMGFGIDLSKTKEAEQDVGLDAE